MLELYITGQNKKFITAGLASTMQSLGYSSAVYKPVDVDALEIDNKLCSKDLLFVKSIDNFVKTYSTYLFKDNTIPILSAACEKQIIEKNVIIKDFKKIKNINECLIIDGFSGLTTPFGKDFLEEDIIKILGLPLVLTVSDINNALLSINRAKENEFRGVIVENYSNSDIDKKMLPKLIEEYTDTKVLGILPTFDENINPNDLITEILNSVDIEKVFDVKIAKLNF